MPLFSSGVERTQRSVTASKLPQDLTECKEIIYNIT